MGDSVQDYTGVEKVLNPGWEPYGRVGSDICSECGISLCAHHAEACEFCLEVYCDCCLYFHLKEPHARKHVVGATVPEHRRSA